MKILFIHQNFPGQYKYLAHALAQDPENEVKFLCNPKPFTIDGVQKIEIRVPHRKSTGHRYVQDFETAIHRGQVAWRALTALKNSGWTPDIISAHPGWGDALFVKDVYPDTPLLNYCEFYYRAFGADVHFGPNAKINPDTVARTRIRNANNIINLEACDWGITPTHWQYSVHPPEFKKKITVLHEGIDTEKLTPIRPQNPLQLSNGTTLNYGDEIVTYISRNLEPYRGFPIFMQSVEQLLKERPQCHVIIIGSDGASYSPAPKDKSFKQSVLERTQIDPKRVHFLGTLPYEQMVQILNYSSAHVYLTVPFVLSWSFLEAMALECLVIASDTEPVQEVIQHGKNGLLFDFFKPEELVKLIHEALDFPENMISLRKAARQTIVDRYAISKTLPLQIQLIKSLVRREQPTDLAVK